MNNNKKYKKWSLRLVAPALVLAPIAVVASCSSSSEEKPAYGVTFTNNDKIKATIHKAVQPTALTDVQFKEEVLAHKSDLFTIEGTLPSDSFLNDNIEIGDLNRNDNEKTVSTTVKLNKANTSGESIEKTITLTGLGYEEVDLAKKEYTITFKQQDPQEIQLTDQGEVLVETLTAEKLIGLVLEETNKDQILEITGNDAVEITNEVLANQILSIDGELEKDANNGKIKFTLKVSNPVNGKGDPLTKEITFSGFKVETDTTAPQETLINSSLSTVTLGLNGNRQEVKDQIDQQWVLEHARILFSQGFELIKDVSDIVAGSIVTEDIDKQDGTPESGYPIKLKFKVAANKWYDNTSAEGTTEKLFETVISGISDAEQQGLLLANKSDASKPLSIALVDPVLGQGTYQDFLDNSADIFNKEFIFKYRKHLLTGDFTKIDKGSADDFLHKYPEDTSTSPAKPATFVKVIPDDSTKTIEIKFTILKDKLEPTQTNDKEYTIKFNGFKASNN